MAIENDGSLTPEQIQAIIVERDTLKSGLGNTVEEIKAMRKSKQDLELAKADLEAKLAAATKTSTDAPKPEDFDKIVDQKISEKLSLKEQADSKIEQEVAWKEFISKNPEFDPETDKTGLRTETFKRELSRFNLSGARKKDDFLAVMQDAVMLLYRKENKEYTSPYASSPSNSGGSAQIQEGSQLSQQEKAAMTRLGWDVAKMMSTKQKHPDLYSSLFN